VPCENVLHKFTIFVSYSLQPELYISNPPKIMNYKFINTDYLDSVSGGDADISREIISMFKTQSAEIHSEMLQNFSKKNYPFLGQLAHKAKSSVAIMGMNDLATMLKTFEMQAKDGSDSESYESYIERFRSETEAGIIELEDYANKL
jgi:HPt (histidine-containing phosphotransfer) domain-containing protein